MPFVGLLVFLTVAFIFSKHKREINFLLVFRALALQFLVCAVIVKFPPAIDMVSSLSGIIQAAMAHSNAGISFVFGSLHTDSNSLIFLLHVLPTIIFFSSLVSVLIKLRIIPLLVRLLGMIVNKLIGSSLPESACASANIFIGQTESPLIVKRYLPSLSNSELFCVLVSGLSSIAGAVMVSYSKIGVDLESLILASVMSAPGGIAVAKILVPENSDTVLPPLETIEKGLEESNTNLFQAAADGAVVGLKLAAIIGATLLAFISLLSLTNGLMHSLGQVIGVEQLSLEYILGIIFGPVAWLLGIPLEHAAAAGNLLGQKIILSEFVAYVNFVEVKDSLDDHSATVIIVALCGFANISSIAILIGGLGTLIPKKKSIIASMGLKAVLAATLVNLISAAMVSICFLF